MEPLGSARHRWVTRRGELSGVSQSTCDIDGGTREGERAGERINCVRTYLASARFLRIADGNRSRFGKREECNTLLRRSGLNG